MLYVYLFAAIAGAVLMGVSLASGGSGEHDADGDGLADVHTGDAHGDHEGTGGAMAAMAALLSLRLWTYLLLFTGLTGLALRYVARLAEPWTSVTAVLGGVLAALLSRALIRRAGDGAAAGALNTDKLVGRSGTVLVPLDRGTTGKVRVQVDNSTIDVLATTDDAALSARDEVLIVEMREGATAHVTRSPTAARNGGGRA